MTADTELVAQQIIERSYGKKVYESLSDYALLLADQAISWGMLGPREANKIWERHILNCAAVSSLIKESDTTIVDVGSGAGLPGLVLAQLFPQFHVIVVDNQLRKTRFLQFAVDNLSLENVTVAHSRIQELAPDVTTSLVTARAVTSLAQCAEWAWPVVREDGRILAIKGNTATQELERDLPAIRRLTSCQPCILYPRLDISSIATTVVEITKHSLIKKR